MRVPKFSGVRLEVRQVVAVTEHIYSSAYAHPILLTNRLDNLTLSWQDLEWDPAGTVSRILLISDKQCYAGT